MDLDSTLCFCFHIPKRKIYNWVKRERPRRASQISECFGAGTGCGWCIPFLKHMHRQIVAGGIVEADDISAAEYEAMRRCYLDGIRSGTRERNTQATEGPPPELAPEKRWDPSDYFSRPAEAAPEDSPAAE